MKKNIIEEQSINDNNYQKLKELFPHAVSIDESGKYSIDPQKLQMSLDPSKAEIKEDGYGLNWVGKKEAYHSAFSKNYKVLKPLKDDSKNWDETENILIKGDNLDALKILRHNYFEAVKMIYIDPPYNTKNDGFVYNDNFTNSTEQTLEELGYDKEYIDYIENIQGAKTHSGWLSFMYPRLLLARDLLKDDGVIFISIDDNEVAQLRLLCDEVFGENNYIGSIAWKKTSGDNKPSFAFTHDTILLYGKTTDQLPRAPLSIEQQKQYSNPDNDSKGRWAETDYRSKWTKEERPNLYYGIINPNTKEEIFPDSYSSSLRVWSCSKETHLKNEQEGLIWWGTDGQSTEPKKKRYLNEHKGANTRSVWLDAGMNDEASQEIKALLNGDYFDTPKPTKLLKKIISIMSSENTNEIFLDFFAGSGTTAHAVMDLNAQDAGNRKFICVQWAETTSYKSNAKKAGYETIFDITKARIDKAGDKILNQVQDDGGLLQTDRVLDIGFRTFEIVEDQKQKIYQKSLEEVSQYDLLAMMEKPDIESNEEILYNLFVAETLPLSTKHQELIKDKLYLASNVAFILGDITSDELVDALKDKKECEYITVYSPNISNDKFTLEIKSNISKLGIKPDKLRFRG